MRKTIALGLALLIGLLLPGCARQGKPIESETSAPVATSDTDSIDNSQFTKLIYEDLYIGEACKSGFVYIEPFSVERTSDYGEVKYSNYPNSIDFYALNNSNVTYNCSFDLLSNVYIPSIEEDSKYYWQGF